MTTGKLCFFSDNFLLVRPVGGFLPKDEMGVKVGDSPSP